MVDLAYEVLAITLAGSMAFVIFKLMAVGTSKWFDGVWHDQLLKGVSLFFVLPIGQWGRALLPEDLFYTPPIVLGQVTAVSGGQGGIPIDEGAQVMPIAAFNFGELLTWIWLGGVLLTLLWQGACFLKFRLIISRCQRVTDPQLLHIANRQKDQLAINSDVQVYISAKVSTPMLVGIFKPIILLPDVHLTNVTAKYVFAHELAHFKRKDLWMKLIVILISALHWFNPIVYWLQKEINRWSEWACDQKVAYGLSDIERKQYGQVILDAIAVQKVSPISFGTAFASSSTLTKKRIERRLTIMLATNKMNITKHLMSLVIAMAILGFAAIPAMAAEGMPQPPSDTATVQGGGSDDASQMTPKKVDYQETRTLGKGKSKTYQFSVNGSPDHNAASIVIDKSAGESYQYISEDMTNGVTLANITATGDSSRELTNLNPNSYYEVTIINLGASDLTYTISLTSYIR